MAIYLVRGNGYKTDEEDVKNKIIGIPRAVAQDIHDCLGEDTVTIKEYDDPEGLNGRWGVELSSIKCFPCKEVNGIFIWEHGNQGRLLYVLDIIFPENNIKYK